MVSDAIPAKTKHTLWLQPAASDRMPTITSFYSLFYFTYCYY